MKKNKIIILIIVICAIMVVGWILSGNILLRQIFQYKGENLYEIADELQSSIIVYESNERIEVDERNDSKILFELLESNLEWKSTKIANNLFGTLDGFTLYPEYDHYYVEYAFVIQEDSGEYFVKGLTFNLSSQENASYVEYYSEYFNTRIYVSCPKEVIDYLKLYCDANAKLDHNYPQDVS